MSTTETATAPVQSRPRSRPLSEYWDVATARWRTRNPIPSQRRG